MEMREQLKTAIAEALKNLGIEGEISFSLDHPTELSHGDYATNVALVASKKMGKNPRDVADELVKFLDPGLRRDDGLVEKIEIAGPGFINFFLKDSFFGSSVSEIISQGENFGTLKINNGKKILVEHSSPNLFKPFHIGHLMNNAIGESLTRIAKFSGATVRAMSFPSDISLGIAKAIAVALENYPDEKSFGQFKKETSDWAKHILTMGEWYIAGTKKFEEDEAFQMCAKEIAEKLYAKIPSWEFSVFEYCKDLNIRYFEAITKRLGSHFDSYIYESEAGIVGKKIVEENTPKVFSKSEGAIIYVPDESKKGLNTLVFINSQGNPTYEAKDIGLLDLKFERESPDLSIIITDNEQIPHFAVVEDAAGKINSEWQEKSKHVPHGRMKFQGQKMSSRLGNVPLAVAILDEVCEDVQVKSEKNSNQEIVDMIAIAAIKFSILRAKPGQNINFDPETSLSFEGDSGPYLQYTHARIKSVLEKAASLGLEPRVSSHGTPAEIERMTYRFPEIIESALSEYAPNYIATYLIEIARAFNSFYGANKIVDIENKEISEHRLAIAKSVAVILKNGLWVLGIEAPERM